MNLDRGGACRRVLIAGCLAAALLGVAGDLVAAPPAGLRPLLVSVDDLPIASPGKHRDAEDRERLTQELLAVLAKHHIRAVGLVTWSNLLRPSDTQLLERWLAAGHELGNHTCSHLDYTATDSTRYIADAECGRAELAALLAQRGARVRFFRFPYLREGDTPEKLAAARRYLARTGQRDLPVTIDNEDWAFEEAYLAARARGDQAGLDSIAAGYHTQLHLEVRDHEARGDALFGRPVPQILLLHANAVGAAHWDTLFTWLERTGHRFASVEEVLADSAFAVPHAYVGRYGCSLWHRLADDRRRTRAHAAITALFDSSSAAWNRGDLDAFCADYADDARFISPSGLTQGRQAVLERYKKKYPDHAAMGTLSFEIIEVRLSSGMEGSVLGSARPAGIQSASVVARWTLAYPQATGGAPPSRETATGLTLLVLRPRGGGKWEIVQDASM